MSNILTIIARIEAKKEKLAFVQEEVLKLVEPTHQEKGCIQYDLHQDNETPEVFIFVENWESKEFLQMHIESEHFKSFVKNTEGSLVDFTVNYMSKI